MYFQHLKRLSKHAGILLLSVKVTSKHAGNVLLHLKRLSKRTGILLLFVKVTSKHAGNLLLHLKRLSKRTGILLLSVKVTSKHAGNLLLLIKMKIKSERNVFYQIIHISTLLLHLHFFSNKDSLLFAPPINPLSAPTNPPENT